MKIAIIGSGISGLTCAYHLHQEHDITLFEANDYVGGHSATQQVKAQSGDYAIDTGFIVFNDRNYPHFTKLLNEIGVECQPTQMSFSVRNEQSQLEYNGHSISSLFAQKSNLVRPSFYRFIFEIIRFNREAKEALAAQNLEGLSLADFLSRNHFSEYFCQNYILPMGAAIWSSTLADVRELPLRFFLQFFANHGLLDLKNRPQWFVIKGGSREYVEKLIAPFKDKIRLNAPVEQVLRNENGVRLVVKGNVESFDQVIFACHSDQALRLIDAPTEQERQILRAIPYQANEVMLHTDERLLPSRKKAWASWNYRLSEENQADSNPTTLTYNMNILQDLGAPETFCVTLNQSALIDSNKILKRLCYSHPNFSRESLEAQQARANISGHNRSWFCGAYWYSGFHEDGVRSALDVVSELKNLAMMPAEEPKITTIESEPEVMDEVS